MKKKAVRASDAQHAATGEPEWAKHFHSTAALQELRDRCWRFLRLDLLYVAAVGAVFTALSVSRAELIKFGAMVSTPAFAFVIIVTMDVAVESMIASELVGAHNGRKPKIPSIFISMFTGAQGFIHATLAGLIIVGLTSYAAGAQRYMDEQYARADIQDLIDQYIEKHGRVPQSRRELYRANAGYPSLQDKLYTEAFSIAPDAKRKYIITFAGDDGKLGTADDDSHPGWIKIREMNEEMEGNDPTAR